VEEKGAREKVEVGEQRLGGIDLRADAAAAAIIEHVEQREHGAIGPPAMGRGVELPERADLGALPAADTGLGFARRRGGGESLGDGETADGGGIELEVEATFDLAGGEAVARWWSRAEELAQERFDRLRPRRAVVATGGAARARILATANGGGTWEAYDLPIVQGTPISGAFSVDFRDAFHGIVGAGDLLAPDAFQNNVARSSDGGQTWQLAAHPTFTGAIYGLTYVRGREKTVVATGPAGVAWSADEGDTWLGVPGLSGYWAVAFASPQAGWLVGTQGRIVKLSF